MHAFVKEDMRLSAKVNDHQESREQEKTKGYRDCEESTCISALKADFEKLRAEKQACMEGLDSLSDRLYRHNEARTLLQLLQAPFFLTKYEYIGKEKSGVQS